MYSANVTDNKFPTKWNLASGLPSNCASFFLNNIWVVWFTRAISTLLCRSICWQCSRVPPQAMAPQWTVRRKKPQAVWAQRTDFWHHLIVEGYPGIYFLQTWSRWMPLYTTCFSSRRPAVFSTSPTQKVACQLINSNICPAFSQVSSHLECTPWLIDSHLENASCTDGPHMVSRWPVGWPTQTRQRASGQISCRWTRQAWTVTGWMLWRNGRLRVRTVQPQG